MADDVKPAKPKVKKDPDFDYNGEWHVHYKGKRFAVFFDRQSNAWLFSPRFLTRAEYQAFGPGRSHIANFIPRVNSKNEVVALLMAAVETNDTQILRWAEK